MTQEGHKILLPNKVEVSFYPKNGELEKMIKLTKNPDFIAETEKIKKAGEFPPFTLLVYDDILALGLYHTDESVSIGVRAYSDFLLIDWIDMALSLRKHPVRVIEKTTTLGEMFKRIKPRTDLNWIEYDPRSQVIREISGKLCPAEEFLESMPATKDMYALAEYEGEVEVVHMRIDDNSMLIRGDQLLSGIKCKGQGKEFYKDSIKNVEKMLKETHPDALVIREPLLYCSHGCESKPHACIAVKFEQIYAKKIGFEPDAPSETFNGNPLN